MNAPRNLGGFMPSGSVLLRPEKSHMASRVNGSVLGHERGLGLILFSGGTAASGPIPSPVVIHPVAEAGYDDPN